MSTPAPLCHGRGVSAGDRVLRLRHPDWYHELWQPDGHYAVGGAGAKSVCQGKRANEKQSIINRSPSSCCRAARTALCKPPSGTAADSVYAAASKGSNFSGELDLDIPPPLIRRKNSNRVEYNVHFSSYVGTFSIFPFIFRQKEKSHRPSDQ